MMWKLISGLAAILVVVVVNKADAAATPPPTPPTTAKTPDVVKEAQEKIKHLEQTMEILGQQLMQQQTFVEERIRSQGMSGIKAVRHTHEGTSSLFGDSHIGSSALNMYNRDTLSRHLGMGEIIAIMNGAEFRFHFNDHKLRKPAHNKNFNQVEDIAFPGVPQAVTSKKTVQEQIEEMRLWFKAFQDQDHSVRDYRKFFKPNLCYLEGGWTLNSNTMNEPATSDRHYKEANNWFAETDKVRFTSYRGSKSKIENFQYLPVTLYNITEGVPHFAQFQVRTMCHPISKDVPVAYFQLQDDLSARASHKMRWNKMKKTGLARFKLNEFGTQRSTKHTFLDDIMGEIPGKDNYGVNLTDNAFGLMNYDISKDGYVPLNVGNYHRWYKVTQAGAMGLQVNHRGFKDENLWVAMTTQKNIMPLSVQRCSRNQCYWETRRVTYALPLEIVYTTPLLNWNPYNIDHHDRDDATVVKDHRNGGKDLAHAFNGTSYWKYYRTPLEFYKQTNPNKHRAKGVLDHQGQLRQTMASGTRFITYDIEGVGPVRLRYPIYPVHAEGTTVGEELQALKEMVMKMSQYSYLYEETPLTQTSGQTVAQPDADVPFHLRDTYANPPGLHGHDFSLTADEHKALVNGTEVKVTTSFNLGHNHELVLVYNKGNHNYYYKSCDGLKTCWDKHSGLLTKMST